MAYSRWYNSEWYTYWEVWFPKEPPMDRDTAKFAIMHSGNEFGITTLYFTAKQLRENLNTCIEKVKEKVPEGDIEELKVYVHRFLKDVDSEFPEEA